MGVYNAKTKCIAVAAFAAFEKAQALNLYQAFGSKKRNPHEQGMCVVVDSWKWEDLANKFFPEVKCEEVQVSANPLSGGCAKFESHGSVDGEQLGQGAHGSVTEHTVVSKCEQTRSRSSYISGQKNLPMALKTFNLDKNDEGLDEKATNVVIEKLFQDPVEAFQKGVVPILAKKSQAGRNLINATFD